MAGSCEAVARSRSVAGWAIPGIVLFFFWVVIVILAIILLAFIVHWAGGGALNLRLGHFFLVVGFT
jgi:nitrogen fixation protein FixH